MASTLARLQALGAGGLDVELYEFFLRWANFGHLRGTGSAPFAHCDHVADHLSGAQSEVITCLLQWHSLSSDDDAENFLARAAGIPVVIDGLIEGLRWRAARGNVMPAPLVRRVQAEIEALFTAAEHPLFKRLAERFPAHAARLSSLVLPSMAGAYRRLRDHLAAYPLEQRLGLWRVPGGDGYYAFLLRAHTTTTLSASEIHELGRRELARLQPQLETRLGAAGCGGATLAERFAAYESSQKLDIPAGAEARVELMRMLERILAEAETQLLPLFGIKPRARVVLSAIPQLQEPNRHNTYVAPAADGSRPGVFEVHVGQLLGGTRWDLYNLIYHEAIPGHHLQLAIAQELGAQPAFRRTVVHDAYIEGWAKYSELLPWRERINTEPLWDIARSRFELYSTANLVLDTGIHAQCWTREQGIAFLLQNTGCDSRFADYMVDRIVARPAQACSYKIGMLTMLGARERMEQARGARFDVRDFHDTVLGQGSLPLSVLDRIVDESLAR
jgi:uncharacterized protein (DUF885 family)